MSVLTRLALRAYPPSFHDRYGAELAALVDDTGTSARVTADLAFGAVRAWMRPTFAGADPVGGRLRATMSTTWVAWCVGFLIAPAVNRALLDQPTPGATGSVRALLDVAYVAFFVGWAGALLGAAPVVLRQVLPALRSRDWRVLRPMLPALLLGLGEAAGLVAIVTTRAGVVGHPSTAAYTGAGIWLAGFIAFIVALGVGPAVSLGRLNPDPVGLRLPTLLTAAVAAALAVATGCSLAAQAIADDGTIFSSTVPVWIAIGVAVACSLTALTSSARGLRAIAR